ncbi:unnamed protein product [Clonostachys solani]|uniref:Uncharacterized protein n=1 Tax=Clonostachys solani TaxID=160281 RepID=A0A9N9YZ10_9HYPO|nr:unnamed protein product [Clonostachys solani]
MTRVLLPDRASVGHSQSQKKDNIKINALEPIPGTACGPYGERLVVQVVDELAERTPHRIYATVTKSAHDVDQGFRDITFRNLADAVNLVSWRNQQLFGRNDDFGVIAYLGVSDIRYAFYLFAAIKTGYKLMIPSVRNSLSQHLAVLDEAGCNILYYTVEMETRVQELKKERPLLRTILVESLDHHIGQCTPHYKYEKTWVDARTDPILIAHSSGSTGNPKPTTLTNGVYSTYDNHRKIPSVPGRRIQSYNLLEFEGGGKFFNPFPPFHLAGLFAMTIMPIFYSCTVTLGPPEKPPSGDILSRAMKQLNIRAAWCPPTVIEELVDLPGGFDQASTLDWIMYTGGPLAPRVGDRLCHVTSICQLYGSTETGPHIPLVPLPENWNYFEWHPLLENEMDPMGDGTFEMVVNRDSSLDWIRHLSQAYPSLDVWRTNDLFVQAPNNPNLWRFVGRRDDVLVLSNGEKFNPVNMEGAITGHPLVRGALIAGTARFQACLIIEPLEYDANLSDSEFIDRIWPTVEEANKVGPAHGRIFRSKVMVAKPDKPFKRAGKGTVIRGQTTRLYVDEIDALYNEQANSEGPVLHSWDSTEHIREYVRAAVAWLLPSTQAPHGDDDDIFVLGMDSLQTSELAKTFQRTISPHVGGSSAPKLAPSSIYANPTIGKLSALLFNILHSDGIEASAEEEETDRVAYMAKLVEDYTSYLAANRRPDSPNKLHVAITGTTGSLGTHLLETIVNDPGVGCIYCLNRDRNAQSRHQADFDARDVALDLDALSERIKFMQITVGDANMGLCEADWSMLANKVDIIIHNAWKVDFNHKLPSFKDHLHGLRDILSLTTNSPTKRPHVFFVSSLSTVGNWPNLCKDSNQVPEIVPLDYNFALPMGYAESKLVAERMITEAVASSGAKATILRVGQIAGPLSENGGEWHRTEWLPTLIKTSKALGCLPDSMNMIDWVPVDKLSQIISEIVQHEYKQSPSSLVYNLVNPRQGKWDELVTQIQEAWKPAMTRAVPFQDWLELLNDQRIDLEKFPALRIPEFYQGLAEDAESCEERQVVYATDNGTEVSPTMRQLQPIDGEAMRTWLNQWKF